MREFDDIEALLRHFVTIEAAVLAAQRIGEHAAAEQLVQDAQAMLGTEDDQWAPLAESTVEEKTKLGYTGRISATDPLYRTGELRTSIAAEVDDEGIVLGSNDPVAAWMEWGTSRIPPRPFIGSTMNAHGQEAADEIAKHMIGAFCGLSGPIS